MYKVKRFSVRPYASKLIREAKTAITAGSDKWEVANKLATAQKKYDKASRKVTSLNPFKMLKNSKDASDSYREVSTTMNNILKSK